MSERRSLVSVRWPSARLEAGVERIEVTPPVGIYHRMWGAAKHEQATGVHRPLTATALVLGPCGGVDPQQQRYLLALDHCLFWPADMHRFLDSMAETSGLPREQMLVCFSHTHGAGLMDRGRSELPGGDLIGPYLDTLAVRCGEALLEANRRRAPAWLTTARGDCPLAANRDYWDESLEAFVCGYNPTGPSDTRVIVGRLTDAEGRMLGTVVNYSCHPTTLAWDNTLISPDYVGAMRAVVEEATGAPCFFLLGACGDLGPREGFVGDPAVADRNGRQLGYAVLSTLETLPPEAACGFVSTGPVTSGATIGTWGYEPLDAATVSEMGEWVDADVDVALPYAGTFPSVEALKADRQTWLEREAVAREQQDATAASDARAMVERANRSLMRYGSLPPGETYPYRARVWQVGDLVWILLDGEHYHTLQVELRDHFPDKCLFIGTVVNGSTVWYLPDRDSYGKGLYQEEASVLKQGSLETLIEALREKLESLDHEATG